MNTSTRNIVHFYPSVNCARMMYSHSSFVRTSKSVPTKSVFTLELAFQNSENHPRQRFKKKKKRKKKGFFYSGNKQFSCSPTTTGDFPQRLRRGGFSLIHRYIKRKELPPWNRLVCIQMTSFFYNGTWFRRINGGLTRAADCVGLCSTAYRPP